MSTLLLWVDEMQRLFWEELFVTRNKELYEQHCSEVENSETERNRQKLQITYGISKRSYLNNFKELEYNVYHWKISKTKCQDEAVGLIPMKYSLFDLIEEHINDNNPLFKDFL